MGVTWTKKLAIYDEWGCFRGTRTMQEGEMAETLELDTDFLHWLYDEADDERLGVVFQGFWAQVAIGALLANVALMIERYDCGMTLWLDEASPNFLPSFLPR